MKPFQKSALFAGIILFLGGCDTSTNIAENIPEAQKQVVQEGVVAIKPTQTEVVQKTLQTSAMQSRGEVVMYKSPTCECCDGWADHLRTAGFTVIEHKRDDMDTIKSEYGVPQKLSSCHTALIGGYIIEGHVPAADVARLLKERPDIAGLTAPGMPMKSPGMQAVGQKPQGYDVLAFSKDGTSKVFTHYK